MIELFDEEKKPLGITKEKSLVHKDGDFHRVSHICIVNRKNEILSNKRSKTKDLYPGKLDMIFGGHVGIGESYEDAAIREIKEEIGLDVTKEQLECLTTSKISYKNKSRKISNNEFAKLFLVRIDEKDTKSIKIQKEEISKILFFTSDKIRELLKEVRETNKFVPFKNYFLMILTLLEGKNEIKN